MKEKRQAKHFRKGESVSFWGRGRRIGRIVKKYINVAAVNNENEIWLVPYTCMKKGAI